MFRKSVFSLNELGQVNGIVGSPAPEEDIPMPHELGEELVFTGK